LEYSKRRSVDVGASAVRFSQVAAEFFVVEVGVELEVKMPIEGCCH